MKAFKLIKNKKIIPLVVLVSLLITTSALAADTPSIFDKISGSAKKAINEAFGGGQEVDVSGKEYGDPFMRMLIMVINSLLTFIGVLFFLLLIYAGYLWLNARGREEQIEKAKKITREALVGLIIIILARIFTELFLTEIGKATK